MKKILTIVAIICIVVVGLSGCTEFLGETDSTDKVKLLIYSVETQRKDGFEKINDGFVNSEDAYRYVVSGTVKNVVDQMLSHVKITVKFYDKNSSYLDSRVAYVHYLDKSQTGDFEVYYYNYDKYFEFLDHVNLSISVS